MTFEGQQINIPIKGIIRAGTDNLCADGSMNEVIGLEYKDGSWLPYKETEADVNLPGFIVGRPARPLNIRKTYVHKTSDNNVHYVILSYDRALYVETERDDDGNVSVALLATDVKDLEMVGNMLCVATDRGIEYYLWKDGEYKIRTHNFPDVKIRVNFGFKYGDETLYGVQYCNKTSNWADHILDRKFNDLDEWKKETIISGIIAAKGMVRDRGGLTGYCFGCICYRMKNGDLVNASAPILLGVPLAKHGNYVDGYSAHNIQNDSEYFDDNKFYYQSADGGEQSDGFCILPVLTGGNYLPSEGETKIKIRDGKYSVGDHFDLSLYRYENSSPVVKENAGSPSPSIISTSITDEGNESIDDTEEGPTYLLAYAGGNGLQFKIEDYTKEEDDDIDSVCIFLSQEVFPFYIAEKVDDSERMFHNKINEFGFDYREHFYERRDYAICSYFVKRKSESDIKRELSEILGKMYLVKEIRVAEIEDSMSDWQDVELKGMLGDNLLVREQLPLSAFDYTKTYANNLSSYNLRLHQFDYSQEAFKGYSVPMMGHNGGLGQYDKDVVPGSCNWEIEVEIEDEDGSRRVVNYGEEGTLTAYMTPILTYPSDKAVSMTIRFFKYTGMGGRMYMKKTYPLRHDMGLGFSYYIDPDLKPISVSAGGYQGTPPNDLPVVEPENTVRYYPNGLKVSDVAYPSYFPAQYTYRIGNEKIIALARLTRPVSQDNFGTFQLIVFCTDGIYTMEVDKTGAGVYTNIAFLSPEVCTNPNTICEIGGAVIFAGDKGLMVLTSGGVEEFTPQLNGEINFSPSDQTQYIKDGQHIFKKIITTNSIVSLDGALSTEDFIDYLHDEHTMVSYVSIKNKILVYNQNKPYVYFIDIATRNTTKLNVSVAFDDDNSPVELYFSKEYNQRYNKYHYTSYKLDYRSADGVVDCLIQSRPIKIQQDDKGSFRLVMTGYFDGNAGQWAELVVLASLDGKNWRAIGVKEKRLEGGFHNLGCVTERGSWKYLMFIFAGQLKNDSHIDSIDLTVEGKYNNKKR